MSPKAAMIMAGLITGLTPTVGAHDIYRHLRDSDGKSCCSMMDCQPAPYRLTAGGVKMFVDGRWIDIPSDRIQYRALLGDTGESGGGHWCGSGPARGGHDHYVTYETICAILPPQAGAARYDPSQLRAVGDRIRRDHDAERTGRAVSRYGPKSGRWPPTQNDREWLF